ncbi:hypothetical protein B9Z19DRAFT_1122068 [Tuber borchii]|uniref:Uncharacterized protein n=1 Tax=Tuber borchii TaxID=42251 RepID=A0A2T7A1J2_TUBBO|nr:hypothetical protein B9Z19DRAFT_1122068 [Tuber borchii]
MGGSSSSSRGLGVGAFLGRHLDRSRFRIRALGSALHGGLFRVGMGRGLGGAQGGSGFGMNHDSDRGGFGMGMGVRGGMGGRGVRVFPIHSRQEVSPTTPGIARERISPAGFAEANLMRYIPATQLSVTCGVASWLLHRVPITKNSKGWSTTRSQEFQSQWDWAAKEVVAGEYYDPARDGAVWGDP